MILKGTLLSVYLKESKKGNKNVAHLCETQQGNKFWFIGWEKAYDTSAKGEAPSPVLMEGQYIEVEATVKKGDIKVNDDGTKMLFLPPNPKLLKVGDISKEVMESQVLSQRLKQISNRRLARALLAFYDKFQHVIEKKDMEFLTSLADGAKQYEAVTDGQKPHVARLLARYTVKSKQWKTAVLAALADNSVEDEDDDVGGGSEGRTYDDPQDDVEFNDSNF